MLALQFVSNRLLINRMLSTFLRYNIRLQRSVFYSVFSREASVWTSDRVVKSPYKDIIVPDTTVDEYVWRNLDKWPTKTAAVCGITNREYTYEQMYKQSRILAANLRKKFKIKDGDIIALIMPNFPEYPIITFGIIAAGAVVTTLNPIYTAYEIKSQLELSDAKLVFCHGDIVPTVKDALKLSKKVMPIISVNFDQNIPKDTVSYKELVEDNHVDLRILREVRTVPEDISFLPYSSGTTGLPKGVELTHRNVIANCEQQNTECRQYAYTTETHQDTLLVILPMFHSYGLGILMLHKMSVGLKLITLPKFQPETFVNTLAKFKINLLYVAPPMVLFMGANPMVTQKHLENLTFVTSGAAPLHAPDIRKLLEKAPSTLQFCQGYGMTEASPLVTVGRYADRNYEDVGYAIPNIELRIVDGNMKNLGPGEIGELLVKGPNLMKGYRNNPKANSEVFVEDGWLRSGDLGKIDASGLLTIVDRLKELIKVNAYQVPPAELESIIKEHPSVFDAAVLGVPDPKTGERPKAFVVLKDGEKIESECIISFVNQRVAPYKRVKDAMFVDSIPKNPSGKILRRVLKEQYC